MNIENSNKKPVKGNVDRVVLSAECLGKIDVWVEQVRKSRPGVEIFRKDIVNWLIVSHAQSLTPNEEKTLAAAHYDELKFLQHAIREIRSSRRQGRIMGLSDFVGDHLGLAKVKMPLKKRKKKVDVETSNQPSMTTVQRSAERYD